MVPYIPPRQKRCECPRDVTCNCAFVEYLPPEPAVAQDADGDDLRDALMRLEAAAWSRSWSGLKKARARVREVTGVELRGRLVDILSRRGHDPR